MELSTRINAIIQYSGKTLPQFAKTIGTQTPQAIRDLTSGKTKTLTKKMQAKILSYMPELNPMWLLTGEGEMIKNSEVVTNSEVGEKPKKDSENNERLIPFYDVETTGGYSGHVSSSEEGVLSGYIHPGGWFDGRETAAIRHVGDSMTEYPNGCVLAVREVNEKHLLVPGRNYVIETREYRVTKRVQHGTRENTIMLYSSNSDKYEDGRLIHEPFEIDLEDVLHIYSVLGYIVNQSGEFRLIKP